MRRFGFFLERYEWREDLDGPEPKQPEPGWWTTPPHHARPERRAFAWCCLIVLGIIGACIAALFVHVNEADGHTTKPCVAIAHRAAFDNLHDENTTEAITNAGNIGAWSEIDVRVTADSQLVLMHDNTVDRSTDGHGPIENMTLDQVRALATEPNGQAVPTFTEAVLAAAQSGSVLVAELKKYTQHWNDTLITRAAAIVAHHPRARVYLGGTTGVQNALARLAPRARTFWRPDLGETPTVAAADARSVNLVLPFVQGITRAEADALRASGHAVGVRITGSPTKWLHAYNMGAGRVTVPDAQAFTDWCEQR